MRYFLVAFVFLCLTGVSCQQNGNSSNESVVKYQYTFNAKNHIRKQEDSYTYLQWNTGGNYNKLLENIPARSSKPFLSMEAVIACLSEKFQKPQIISYKSYPNIDISRVWIEIEGWSDDKTLYKARTLLFFYEDYNQSKRLILTHLADIPVRPKNKSNMNEIIGDYCWSPGINESNRLFSTIILYSNVIMHINYEGKSVKDRNPIDFKKQILINNEQFCNQSVEFLKSCQH